MERTFILIKPDGFARGLCGEVLARAERKGFRLVAARVLTPTEDLLAQHYAEHVSKPFYPGLVEFMSSGPVLAAVLSGENVIAGFRSLAGATNPLEATPGTIRADFATSTSRNIVHGSDSEASAAREIALWFGDEQPAT